MVSDCKFKKMREVLHSIYAFESYLAKKRDLLLNEAVTLCMLEDGHPRRSTDLADDLGVTYSLMSRTLNAIEKKGFVDRAIGPVDKREMHFTITKVGKKALKETADGFDFSEFIALFGK